MKRTIAALATLLTIALGACGGAASPGAGSGDTPTPTPSYTTHDETLYSIRTPAGWTRKTATGSIDAKQAFRYESTDGRFFVVAIDPMGSDFAYDQVWYYTVSGGGITVGERETDCTKTEDNPYCAKGDGKFDGYLMWPKDGASKTLIGGHQYYFWFGSTKTETPDVKVFEDIAESLKVKGA